MKKSLVIRLIGAFSIADSAGKDIALTGRKDRAVLAFLAAHPGRAIARERLVELIWPEAMEGAGRASLRQSLSTIRKAIGQLEVLAVDRDTVTLIPNNVQTDVGLIAEVSPDETLIGANPLANGESFLDDLGGISADFDSWRATELSRLLALVSELIDKFARQAEESKHTNQAVAALSQLVALDSLNEDAQRRYMRALITSGQPNSAIRQYQKLDKLLREELGVEPEPATRAILNDAKNKAGKTADGDLAEPVPQASDAQPNIKADEGGNFQTAFEEVTGNKPARPDKPSVAVMAFQNLSVDPDQGYFSDGITEDIITELSRFPNLFVIARNSSFAYKNTHVDVRQIGRELGVRFVVEGSVRRSENRIRVTAQLIDAETGNHHWAERFDRGIQDIFEVQEEITQRIVASVAPKIDDAELARAKANRSISISAYDLALRAQSLVYDSFRAGKEDYILDRIGTAKLALEEDKNCTLALLTKALGELYCYVYRWGPEPDNSLNAAQDTIDQLFTKNSADPRGYALRGLINHFRNYRTEAIEDLRRAVQLNPNYTEGLIYLAWAESLDGMEQEARAHVTDGLRLSPHEDERMLGVAYLALAQASFAQGQTTETRKWARKAIQMMPHAPIRRILMVASSAIAGNMKEAQEHRQLLSQFAPDFMPDLLRGKIRLFKNDEHNAHLQKGLQMVEAEK